MVCCLGKCIPMDINTHQENLVAAGLLYTIIACFMLMFFYSDIWKVGLLWNIKMWFSPVYLNCLLFFSSSSHRTFPLMFFFYSLLLLPPPLISLLSPGPGPSWQTQPSWVQPSMLTQQNHSFLGPAPTPHSRISHLSRKKKGGGGISPTASELAKCLPLNLPTLSSTALLGTVPNTPSFPPLILAHQTQAEVLIFLLHAVVSMSAFRVVPDWTAPCQ